MSTATTFPRQGKTELSTIVGLNVRSLMARRGVSQMRLAEVMGLSQTAVSRRLRGLTPWDTDDLERVAVAFGVTPASLLNSDWTLHRSRVPRTPIMTEVKPQTPCPRLVRSADLAGLAAHAA